MKMKKDIQKIDALLDEIIAKANEIKGLIDETKEAPEKTGIAKSEAIKPTLEDVRKVLTEKSRSGKTAEVKALLKKHGSNRLSEVNPDDYENLLKEAEEL